ncbi:unnamed protein product [Closterium sp. NIES-53]
MSLPRPLSAFDGDSESSSHDLVAGMSSMAHGRHSVWSDTDLLADRHRASQSVAAEQCSLTCDLTNTYSLSCDSIPILEPELRTTLASRIFERRASEHNHFPRDDCFTSRAAIASTSENTANAASATAKVASRGREFVRSMSEFSPSLQLGSAGTNSACSGPTSVFRVRGTGGFAIPDFHIDDFGQLSTKDDSVAPPLPPTGSMVDRLELFPDPEPILFLLPDGSVRFFCRGARDPLLRVADVMREYPGLHVGVASGSRASLGLDPASVLLSAPSATYFLHPPHPAARSRSGIARGMSTSSIAAAGSRGWIAADDFAARGSGSVGNGAAFCGAAEDADRMIRGIELQLDRFERRLRREFSAGIAPAAAGAAATAAACSDRTASATRYGNDESDSESFLLAAATAVSQPFNAECSSSGRESALSLSGPLPFAAYPAKSGSLTLNPSPLPLSPPESPRPASSRPAPRLHLAPATPPPAPTPASPSSPRLSARSRTEPRNSHRSRNRYGDRDTLTGGPSPVPSSRRSNTTGGSHYGSSITSGGSSSGCRRGSSVYPRSSSSPSSSSPPTSSPSFSCATPASSHSHSHSHSLWNGGSSSSSLSSSAYSSHSSSSSSITLSRPPSCSSAGASSGFSSFASSTSTSPLPTGSPFSLKSASFSSFSSSSSSRINRHHSKSADSSESGSSYSNPTSVLDLTSVGRIGGGGGSGGSGGVIGRSTSKLWPACLTPPRTRGDGSTACGGQAHEPAARRHGTRKAPLHHRSRSISYLCGSSSSNGGGGSIAENGGSSDMASQQHKEALPTQTRASQSRRKPKTKASRSDSELFNDAAFESQFCEVEQGELDSDVESPNGSNGGVLMACGPVYPLSPLWRPSGQHGVR